MKTVIAFYTTITRKVQQAAQQAVRNNVLDHDMRHGYRGLANVLWKVGESAWDNNKITDTLKASADLWSAAACRDHQRQCSGS
ncbi:hypothetical protein MJ524_26460 [Escherichia coli]|nr:hypothetical protein MJ524_26460 [Escherichia coli]